MKGLKRVTIIALGAALLAGAPPAAAQGPAYRHYVACGTSPKAKPSHFCEKPREKGAFFRSNRATVRYSVCVRFPGGGVRCREGQKAKRGVLYVNEINTNIPGKHRVSWFVAGKRVGVFSFRVSR